MVQAGKHGTRDRGNATARLQFSNTSAKRKKNQTKPKWLSVINRKTNKIKKIIIIKKKQKLKLNNKR
jgi:hypothetical protein